MDKTFIILPMLLCASVISAQTDSIGAKHLDELVVKGEIPQVKSNNGTLVVDLPSIVKDKPVTSILESLIYLPGVIANNGLLSIAGATSTTILINGELTQMDTQQLYQLLNAMPVDRIKNVEIMYSAPGQLHVDGAVINIVLKAPSALDGLQGQARLGCNQNHYLSYGGGAAATFALKNWAFDCIYSVSKTKSWQSEDMTSWHNLPDGLHLIEEKDRGKGSHLANLVNASVAYKTLRLTYNAQVKSDNKNVHASSGTLGAFCNRSIYNHPVTLQELTMSYKSSFGLSLVADYLAYRERRGQIVSDFSDVVLVDANYDQRISRGRFSADMQHDIHGWTLGYGAQLRINADKSLMKYAVPENPGFDNKIGEQTADAYVSIKHAFPWGLSFVSSLGEELYHTPERDNWILKPQIGLTYFNSPKHIFQGSFHTTRDYPAYWKMHGGIGYLNPYSEIWGNPALLPSTTYATSLSYIFNQKYVATLFFNYIDDYSVQLPYQSGSDLKLIFQEQNLSYESKIGFSISVPFSIGDMFDIRVSSQGYFNKIKADRFHDIRFKREKFSVFGRIDNTFQPTGNLAFSISAYAYSPSLQGIADLSSLWSVDLGAKWTFGKAKCCELNLNATDIFNHWSPTMRIKYGTQNYKMVVRDMARAIKLTFAFRFNDFKPKETQIDTSRLGI